MLQLLAGADGEVSIDVQADIGPKADEFAKIGMLEHSGFDIRAGSGGGGMRGSGEKRHFTETFAITDHAYKRA